MTDTHHLSTYLSDHLAGSVVALELLEHLEKNHHEAELQKFFAGLRKDIVADRHELESLMNRLAISISTLRSAIAWFAEKAARLKLRFDDSADGSFRLLEATELVATGIDGKRSLWLALAAASEDSPRLRGPDYGRLIGRAIEQRQRIEAVRLAAARAALKESGAPKAPSLTSV
jgi:hypothetical protein